MPFSRLAIAETHPTRIGRLLMNALNFRWRLAVYGNPSGHNKVQMIHKTPPTSFAMAPGKSEFLPTAAQPKTFTRSSVAAEKSAIEPHAKNLPYPGPGNWPTYAMPSTIASSPPYPTSRQPPGIPQAPREVLPLPGFQSVIAPDVPGIPQAPRQVLPLPGFQSVVAPGVGKLNALPHVDPSQASGPASWI